MPYAHNDTRPDAESVPVEPPRKTLGPNASWWGHRPEISPRMALWAIVVGVLIVVVCAYTTSRVVSLEVEVVPDARDRIRVYHGEVPPDASLLRFAHLWVSAAESYGWMDLEKMSDQVRPLVLAEELSAAAARYQGEQASQVVRLSQTFATKLRDVRVVSRTDTGAIIEALVARVVLAEEGDRTILVTHTDVVITLEVEKDLPTDANPFGVAVRRRSEVAAADLPRDQQWWRPAP